MSSSSDSSECESDNNSNVSSRLGKCEVCDCKDAKYTCPKCEVKTCSIKCVDIHKRELDCDGIRDRTKFIPLKQFTTSDLLSDYRLLEECARFVYAKKRDEKKRFTRIDKDLPVHLFKLKTAARNRGTALTFLTKNFARHASNTTYFDWKTNIISWRVEFIFPNGTPEAVKYTEERCPENERVTKLLEKYLSPSVMIEGQNKLQYYHAAGFNGVKVLLKAEKVKGSSKKYYELDPAVSLGDNLAGKCIVEYPIICVVLKDHAVNFDIVSSDDELEDEMEAKNNETTQGNENKSNEQTDNHSNAIPHTQTNGDSYRGRNHFNKFNNRRGRGRRFGFDGNRKRENRELVTEKFAKEKKLELQKEIKADRKKKPKNLLFTTGYSSDESIELEDDK